MRFEVVKSKGRRGMKVVLAFTAALLVLPVCATGSLAADEQAKAATATDDSDVIAMVGDQPITFSEINVALNSSAIVGISIPALGTPERDTARVIVLDRFVSANLLYLDAFAHGVDKDPRYQKSVSRFSAAILAGLYRKRIQGGEIAVTDQEIQAYFKKNIKNIAPDTALTDDVRLQIEAALRRQKLHERLAVADKALRNGVQVKVYEKNLNADGDALRADDTPLAEVGGQTLTWGAIGDRIVAAGSGATLADPLASESKARRDALEHEIDLAITVQKARAEGLEQDPLYRKRMNEYQKTVLTNLHREQLTKAREPSEQELKAYYEQNRSRFVVPEARKLQMVVVKTKKEATALKHKIEAGEMTLYEAARDHSIAANAKKDLGEVGWVNQGELAPALDKVVFALDPDKLGGPVESPAGWHLVKVLDMNDAKYTDFSDEDTRKLVRRRYLHEKIDDYTAALRKDRYPVQVYQDRLVRLEQQEADMVKSLAQKAEQPGSVTQKRIEELNKLIKPPM